MLTTTLDAARDGDYLLARTTGEYERLRDQARMWEPETGRLLDRVGLGPGASCLDVGCGPGETMRLMAERVGPAGQVTGVDVDAPLGLQALGMLRAAGHQCRFEPIDARIDRWLETFARIGPRAERHAAVWPLLIGTWKRK